MGFAILFLLLELVRFQGLNVLLKLYITIIAPIMAKEFLNERKDFLFLNLLLMVEKNLSFQKDSAKLKKYIQKDLFEQRSCIFIIFCSRRAPHFGHVILVFIGGDLLLNGGSPQMSFKIFINIILKIIKKLTQLKLIRRKK